MEWDEKFLFKGLSFCQLSKLIYNVIYLLYGIKDSYADGVIQNIIGLVTQCQQREVNILFFIWFESI